MAKKRAKASDGLTPINCAECGRYLDRAQPEFLAKYPNPKCWHCNNPSDDSGD
jgi:phage FluMu protein Com